MRKNVCVFCASGDHIPEVYKEAARHLGELCAEKGITLINGAGSMGLMGTMTNAALPKGGKVVGVIPQFMVDLDWNHKGLTETHITKDMASRKQLMRDLSDGIITMAGGAGTMEELWETFTSRQLHMYDHPIIILNTNGFYDPIKAWIEKCVDEVFIRKENASIVAFADTPEEALELFLTLPDRKPSDIREERH